MRNTRADVVAAALRVLAAQGLESCSMRRVAAELDVQPSALYHHVPNKQSLLALMADEIVRRVRLDGSDPRALCTELRAAMLAVRDGADVVATVEAFRLGTSVAEGRLAELVGADGAKTLLLYTFGHTQSTQTHRQAAEFGALLDLPQTGTPAARPEEDLDGSFARGIDIILAGLAAGARDPGRANTGAGLKTV
ncbi:TetR/AcrR family transcriptional regulator [Leucobacter sp. G161]|uniref:TetR/AcrR family transcriptional regulator n=1 Tax=Leucobacter sp. G161 TaxID=663704 RepID=UPI00073B97B8|nr:TetR family transcriptional regulator [Leucobacter sp. G161]KUF06837.1 TetR family transcriptional regulator [Leucobacter sp. G161]